MPSRIVADYREHLRKKGQTDLAEYATDESIAKMVSDQLASRNIPLDKFAEGRGDPEFVPLVKEAYGSKKTLVGGAIDAIGQQYYTKKQGFKQGLASVAGAVGMDETERDLMRSAQDDARDVARKGREVFDDYTMIDDFGDFLKYFAQGSSRSVVDIVPSMVTSIAGRGVGKQIQKAAEKTGKFKDLEQKAKKYLGDDYGGRVGMGAGALGSSSLENTGHVYGDLYEYTKLDPSDEMYLDPAEARALSMFAGGVSGTLDSAVPVFLLGKLSKSIGRDAAEREVTKLFRSLPEGAVFLAQGAGGEGATEALQEVVQMATVKHHTGEEWTEKDWERMVNGGLLGAIGGGTVTAATGGVSRLLQPGQTEQTELGETEEEVLESTDERINIRNSFEEKRIERIKQEGIGTVVSPVGSRRLARVLQVEEDNSIIIEYPNGNTEKVKATELSVIDGKNKVIKPEDLIGLSDEKLEDLKKIKPQMVDEIDSVIESRKEEVDDDTIQTAQTQLEVKVKGNQLLVNDVSSRERLYSATFREEDGILYVENETLDAPTDQRKTESLELLRRQAKRKAKADGLILSMGGKIEVPVTKEDIDGMEVTEVLELLSNQQKLLDALPEEQKGILDETISNITDKLKDEGMLSFNKEGKLQLAKVETKKSNSARLRNDSMLGGILGYKIFTDLEGDIKSITESHSQSAINRKLILARAKEYADLYVGEIDGLNKVADVKALADGATDLFVKHHLQDNQWKKKTPFDIQAEEDEKKAAKLAEKQKASDAFELHKPEQGQFVKLSGSNEFVKITSVDPETNTIKTEATGDNSVAATAIVKTDTKRRLNIEGFNATENKDGITTRLLVTGSDTNGVKKGRASAKLSVTDKGKVLSVTYGDKSFKVDDLNLKSEDLKQQVGMLVLDDNVSATPKVKRINLGGGVFQKGDTYEVKSVKIGKTKHSRNKFDVTPDVTAGGQVVGFSIGETKYAFDAPQEIKGWTDVARSKMLQEKLFKEKESAPKLTKLEQQKKEEAEAIPDNAFEFRSRKNRGIDKVIIPSVEKMSLPDVLVGKDVSKFLNSIDMGEGSGSSTSKKAVVLKYYKEGQDENPAYLVRTLRNKGDTKVITKLLPKKGRNSSEYRAILPLTQSTGDLDINGSKAIDVFERDEEHEGRLELADVLTLSQEASIEANFDSQESYDIAMSNVMDYEFIRNKETAELQTYLEENLADDERAKRIYPLVMSEGKLNPLLEIYEPNLKPETLKSFQDKILKKAVSIKGSPSIKTKGKQLGTTKQIRITDLLQFMDHISEGKEGKEGYRSGFQVLGEGEFDTIERAVRKYTEKGGKIQKAEKGTGSDVLSGSVGLGQVGEAIDQELNPLEALEQKEKEEAPDIEEEQEIEEDTGEESEEKKVVQQNVQKKTPPKSEEKMSEEDAQRKQIAEMMYDRVESKDLDPAPRGRAMKLIKEYENGNLDAGNAYTLVEEIVSEFDAQEGFQSVGEIATTEEALERELKRHIDEPRRRRLKTIPLSEELQSENATALEGFLNGLQIDGEPIRLTALLNKVVLSMDGSTELTGSLLDMAQTLLAHPYAKKLKVEFRSWERFKDGIQYDGNNGKLTRAYIKGDTIVMGPSYKLSESDLSADDAIRVAFLEEVAHRVLASAVEASIQAKTKGKLPRGASSVLSMKQAVKFYDETKAIMDWLRTQTDGEYYHGLQNMHEFWANFATNPKFRKFLNRPLPPQLANKFKSRFERAIDWVLDLASKIFDVDFTPNRTASDEIRKRYRTLLRTSDKLAANDVDLMPSFQMESAEETEQTDEAQEQPEDNTEDGEQSVVQGTLRAHMAAIRDFGDVVTGVIAKLGETTRITPERIKEFATLDGGATPDVVAKVLGKKAKLLAEEAAQQFAEATSPNIQKALESARNLNDLETRANKDTGARNLMNILSSAIENVRNLYSEAVTTKETVASKLIELKGRLDALSSPKTMFDASKTQGIFGRHLKSRLFSHPKGGKESSQVNAFEAAHGLKPTSFSKLREVNLSEQKLYELMERLAEVENTKDFIEQKTAKEIFDLMDIKAADIGISDPELDQAVQVAVALMLGSDQKNDVPRSAFTTRLRLASGKVAGHSVQEAVNLIKQAAQGKPTPDIKDKSMMSILKNVRKIKEEIDALDNDLSKAIEEEKIAEAFLEAYKDRRSDLDEYLDSTAPVAFREGGRYDTLRLDSKGKIVSDNFTFSLGKGESSDEAKYMARIASELFKIMDTDEYKEKYAGSPKHRYFKQLATELRKPNFGIQYTVSNVGFLHAAASSLQERVSRLGPAGKAIARALNEYTRDYQSEAGRVFAQGKRVSGALRRLHLEMSPKGENLNQFIKGFGSKLFDWFNERPDLQGQEEQAINKVWKELKAQDPDRNYTEEGRKALRAYLKQWSIQNENFQRLYRKYDISVMDESVARESIATGSNAVLYRRFVDQGVFTTPRKLNMSKVSEVAQLLDPKLGVDENFANQQSGGVFDLINQDIAERQILDPDYRESFTQSLGKLVDSKLAQLFFKPIFMGKSAHAIPLTLTSATDEGKNVRVLMPEELERAWRNADGKNVGIKVANAILDLASTLPDADTSTISNLLSQFKHRANALIRAEIEAREGNTEVEKDTQVSMMMKGAAHNTSIHARALYNILPGEFFEYEMYDETSSGQYLSKILMTAKFGREGEILSGNYKTLLGQYESSYNTYKNLSEEIGMPIKKDTVPSKTNKITFGSRKKKMQALIDEKGIKKDFDKLDLEARSYVEAKNAMAALNAAFTSRSSNNEDITTGLEFLRTLAFGMVNTMKGAWTATMSIADIVKVLGLNPTAFRAVGKTYANLAREIAGSVLESFGIEMLRADKYASELNDVFSREAGMMTFRENITEVGRQGSIKGFQKGLRDLRNIVQSLSMVGASKRRQTSGNYIPGSLLTPITAPFSYLAQATNKSIALSMANTIERFVLRTAEAMDARGITLDNNTFEVKPKDLGYEDSKLDAYIFGNMDMVEKLNQRLVSEGMSFSQLAQDYRRRKQSDPNAKVLTKDAVLASYNLSMSEVTYDTMSGKGSWSQSGAGQFLSPLVSWSVSAYSKGVDQMRNKEGQLAMRESIRFMLMSSAWLVPAGIAFTLFTDWWDEEILGKPSSLRKVPATAALPIIGLPLAMTDARFDAVSVMERAARANNVLGIAQEFISPIIIGQLDPSSMAGRFDPTRRVLAISAVMNTTAAITNYVNAVRTSEGKDWTPDYSTVIRPLMFSMGLNSVIQNAQMATHLTDIEELDPTGFLSTERQVADITGMRNSLRTMTKVMGMEMRKGGFMTYTATAMGNALKAMERAAYANDKEAFKEAYRKAVSYSDAEDPVKDVADKFKRRNIRQGVTRYALTDADMSAILSVLSDSRREKLMSAMRNHEFYLRGIGGTPTKSRNDTAQYSEELRRLAL